jgi:hypothetical protein
MYLTMTLKVCYFGMQAVLHYGEAIKAVMNEELGDGCAPLPACQSALSAMSHAATAAAAAAAAVAPKGS